MNMKIFGWVSATIIQNHPFKNGGTALILFVSSLFVNSYIRRVDSETWHDDVDDRY